ncbi:hypothetical protein [Persicobacter sp. CCB-QB2]|uniref:hypothetical protein n=1 Tax=Persicobacter sp. CCB-QB2 TaxID=1561025 RepID=UPI0006A98450|nr:hypothetical protein [Persicobacter sp. CCB-QB2]
MSFSTKTGQFSWKDLNLIIDGRPMLGFTDVEYTTEVNLEAIYGAGDMAQYIGEGNEAITGSIELLQSNYEALVEEAKKRGRRSVAGMEVDMLVSYIPKSEDPAIIALKTIVDRIVGAKFSTAGKKFTQGDTHAKVSIPFLALRVEAQI